MSNQKSTEATNQACTSGVSPPATKQQLHGLPVSSHQVKLLLGYMAADTASKKRQASMFIGVCGGQAYVIEGKDVVESAARHVDDGKADFPGIVTPEQASVMVSMAIGDRANKTRGVLEIFTFVARKGQVWSLPLPLLPSVVDGSYVGPGVQ